MAEGKKGFVLYADQYEIIKQLPDDLAGKLMKHIFSYVNDEYPKSDDAMLNLAFAPFKIQLKRDLKKYERICERNQKNGLKGGRPKNPENPVGSLVTQENPVEPKKPDIEKDKEIDKEIEKKSIKRVRKTFTKPNPQEVSDYANTIDFNLDGQLFVDFYESKDWMIGKNKMKDWKAAVRTWKKKDGKNGTYQPANGSVQARATYKPDREEFEQRSKEIDQLFDGIGNERA